MRERCKTCGKETDINKMISEICRGCREKELGITAPIKGSSKKRREK